jgi:hypothetical protein
VPIQCNNTNLSDVLSDLPASRTSFPLKYLGLPLSMNRLKRVDFQPWIDKVSTKLSTWSGKNLSAAGRLTLVNAVLTSQVTYLLLALNPPQRVLDFIDSKRKQFLWAGSERLTGGKCKVNWVCAARPKQYGGLGILHLGFFSWALRLRWLWQEAKLLNTQRMAKDIPCNMLDRRLFAAATSVRVGDGKSSLFWESAWLRGMTPRDTFPLTYSISNGKNRSIHEALSNNRWIQDLHFNHNDFSAAHIHEYCQLWCEVNQLRLMHNTPDLIKWKFTMSGQYTTQSAYQAQFYGSTCRNFNSIIWRAWAPPKCKFFSWLAVQNRVWTADRLARRGWPHNPRCVLCASCPESGLHLFAECCFTRHIWADLSMWVAITEIHHSSWQHVGSVRQWWSNLATSTVRSVKGL